MKTRSLIAAAVAGSFAWSASAFAGGVHHSTEVQTPMQVSESAPWLAADQFLSAEFGPRMTGSIEHAQSSDAEFAIGSSSHVAGSGSVAFDSTHASSNAGSSAYWMMGAETEGTGAMPSTASGSVGFDSTMSSGQSHDAFSTSSASSVGADESVAASDPSEDGVLVSEVYIVPAPLASFNGESYWTMEVMPDEESIDRLASVTDYYVITPIYDDAA
jgi:hypothetical protein